MRRLLLLLLFFAHSALATDYYNILDTQGIISASTAFRAGNGSASVPSYSFTNGTTTGLMYDTGGLGIVTGGTERWLVNSSGALNPIANSAYDIGNGSTNPRDVYVSRNLTLYGATSGSIAASASGTGGNLVIGNLTLTNPGSAQTAAFTGTSWTPTVTSSGGTITSYTSAGTYTRIGSLMFTVLRITITDAGTGSGQLDISNLPGTAQSLGQVQAGTCREDGATGKMGGLWAVNNSATGHIQMYDGTTNPVVTGYVWACQLTYYVQ